MIRKEFQLLDAEHSLKMIAGLLDEATADEYADLAICMRDEARGYFVRKENMKKADQVYEQS